MLKLCLGFLLICLWMPFTAQAQHKQLKFKKTDQKQGLSHNKVYALLRDSKGFMWFGTKAGLNLYDGYSYTVFQKGNDSTGLVSSHIQSLYEDSKGNIWIGTYDGGISLYNRYQQTFRSFQNDPEDDKSLSSNNVFAILEDSKKNIWIGTYGGGLCKYNENEQNFTVFKHLPQDPSSLSNNAVFDIYEDKEGQLWLATFGGGLSLFNPAKNTFTNYTHSPANPQSIPANDLFTLCGDPAGNIWMGSYGNGLIKFDRKTYKFTNYRHTPDDENTISSNYVVDVETDPLGNIWIGTREGGLNYLEATSEKFCAFKNLSGETGEYTAQHTNINTISLDKEGMLWVGTDGEGIYRAYAVGIGFNNFTSKDALLPGFEARSVTALYEDHQKNLWIGTFGEGLYKINKNKKDIKHYSQDFLDENSVAENFITSIAEGEDHAIWIGTLNSGLSRYDPQTGKFTNYQANPSVLNGLSSNAINTLYADKRGALWIGTDGGGLCRLDTRTGTFTTFFPDPYHPNASLAGTSVKVIFEDEQSLWIGTKESGISRLDLKTYEFTNFRYNKVGESQLPSNEVTSIAKDCDGGLWIGTFDKGIFRLDVKNNKYDQITAEDGLISDNICSLQSGNDSTLWISTVEGLSRLKPATLEFQNFTDSDGLYNHEFIQWSGSKSADGKLYFGYLGGFVQFNPAAFSGNTFKFPVYITSFLLFDEKKSLEIPNFALSDIALNHDDNFFELEYAFLNFRQPEKITYAYMMENLDQEWKFVGQRRVASYTNLDAGTYYFKVKASSGKGIWYEIAQPITIVIYPAWYNTWWFRIITTLSVIGCCFGYYFYKINAVNQQNRLLENMVAQRTSELVEKNEEILTQKENIVAQNNRLVDAQALIEERNNDLRIINEELEDRVILRTQELQTANVHLKKANEELDTFVYRSYHDIIGPLSRIHGLCHVALLDVEDAKALEYIHKLGQSCEDAKHTLQRVLRIHDIRNHKLIMAEVNILDNIHKISSAFQDNLQNLRLEINCDSNFGSPLMQNDSELLTIVLQNVIENAVKYNRQIPESYVRISLSNMPGGFVKVGILDNGIGIPKEVRNKVFSMFFRGTADKSGIGLGLYHAKVAVQRIGGEIKYEHTELNETLFEILIPGKEWSDKANRDNKEEKVKSGLQ